MGRRRLSASPQAMQPESKVPPSGIALKDRSARLILFGLLSIAVGGACLLLSLVHVVLPLATRRMAGTGSFTVDPRSQLMGVIMYFLLGAAFVFVGAGSIRKRRWVRSLMLILAWTWLLGGLLVIPFLPGVLDGVLRAGGSGGPGALSPGVVILVKAVIFGIAVFGGVLLPALFVWVYRDRSLQQTCEAYNPSPTWTERCPIAVLGLSLGLAAFAALSLAIAVRPVVPWFGRLVTGWPGSLVMLASAVSCAYLAWSTFKLRSDGWWGSTVLLVGIGISTLWTLGRVELIEFYRAMGYPDRQLELLEFSGAMNGPLTFWLTAIMTVLTVLYMVGILKHFRGSQT
jgi:hypothetical protein